MIRKRDKVREGARILYVPLELLRSYPYRARTVYPAEAMASLVRSIAENGILEPLTVCYDESDVYYVLSGERRLRAARTVGINLLPCLLVDGDEAAAALYSAAAHLQQTGLDDFEKAEFLERTCLRLGCGYGALAEKTGVAEPEVRESARLLSVPESLRKKLRENGYGGVYGNILLRHADDREKRALTERIIRERLSPEAAKEASMEILEGRREKNRTVLSFYKDLTVFVNTIDHAVETMRESGIAAESEKTETGESVEYHIRIPKLFNTDE